MGNSSSGESLDTVSLWREVEKVFTGVGLMKKSELGVLDYMRYKVSFLYLEIKTKRMNYRMILALQLL